MEISDERRQNCVDGSCRSHNAPEADVSFGSFARILRCPPSRPLSTIYCAPLARPFAAMRSWLAVSDCAHAAREARGRSMWVGIFAQNHTERHAIAGPRAFSGLCDDEGVPLICPTCQVLPPKRPCRRPPATLHGVVFDIFVGSHSDPARLRESCLKPHPSRAGPGRPTENPMRASRLRRDSVDAVERGHDISCTVDPGHCSGARYERAAKRSHHRVC